MKCVDRVIDSSLWSEPLPMYMLSLDLGVAKIRIEEMTLLARDVAADDNGLGPKPRSPILSILDEQASNTAAAHRPGYDHGNDLDAKPGSQKVRSNSLNPATYSSIIDLGNCHQTIVTRQ